MPKAPGRTATPVQPPPLPEVEHILGAAVEAVLPKNRRQLEAVLRDRDAVRPAAPFANQPRARPDLRACLDDNLTVGPKLADEVREPTQRCLRMTSMRAFLQPMGDGPQDQVAAQLIMRGFGPKETTPLRPECPKVLLLQLAKATGDGD